MPRDVGKGLDPKRDERETRYAAGDETYRGRRVQETGLEVEDVSRSGRRIWRQKTHWKAEDASEGGRCIGRRRRRRKQKQSSRWKGVVEGGSPYKVCLSESLIPPSSPRIENAS